MRNYIVWSPGFDRSSGGICVLHRLAVELQKRGLKVFINTEKQNPHWPRIYLWEQKVFMQFPDSIAIYPEIIQGNPFYAHTVVRYLLNIPGACSANTADSYGKDDILYTYSRLFNTKLGLPDDRVMLCPHIDLNVFYDKHLPRNGRMKYRGKGQQSEDKRLSGYPLLGSKEGFRGDDGQERLAEALSRCSMLYVYDNATAITEIARLCGAPVVIIPDGSYTKEDYQQHEFWNSGGIGWCVEESPIARDTRNSDKMRANYENAEVEFQKRLDLFVETTQRT